MRVTDVETFAVDADWRNWFFVQVKTDEGITGVGIAIVLGATPTGPLYVAFSVAADLLEKNASVTNVVVFLTAWACLKLPQELVELQFLGWRFMMLRLVLTAVVAVGMGFIIQTLLPTDSSGSTSVIDSE